MKRENLIAGVIIIVCFFAGIFLADYVRSNKQSNQPPSGQLSSEQLPSAPQITMKDLKGKPSPDFSLMDVNGKLRHASEWQGKVLVINFWASWCPPCIEEIPHFIQLQEQYGEQGLQFVGIGLESVDEIGGFSEVFGINYPLLVGSQEVIKLANAFGNRTGGLPYTIIIDRSGIINFIKQGPLPISKAEQVITSLL